MESEEFCNTLKEFMISREIGCPWLDHPMSPPTASSIAFAWPSPRLQPLGATFISSIPNNAEPSKPFIIINVDSVPKLTSYNYLIWKSKIESLLISYNVYSFVDGTTSIPPKAITKDHKTKHNPAYYTWYRQDKLIYGALADTLSEPIGPLINTCSTAQEAWNTIAQTYAAIPSQTRIQELNTKLCKTTKTYRSSITEYIQSIKDLVDELALLGHTLSPEDVTACILDGLDKFSDFKSVVDAVHKRDTPISLEELHQELLSKELSMLREDYTPIYLEELPQNLFRKHLMPRTSLEELILSTHKVTNCHWFDYRTSRRYAACPKREENLDYKNVFKLFDINGDGLINIKDYKLMMSLWGIEIAEIDLHGKKSVDLSEFINLLSSLSFKVGEPLYHIFLYQLFNNHPLKQALQEAHINKLIAKFRKNHWGKVKNLMNENKMKNYWMVFSLFDMNGDGLITTYDFKTLMLIWGLSSTDMLDNYNFEDGNIDFWDFLKLVDDLDIHILEPLYHFAIFSLIEHHLNIALIPEDQLWNFSAIIRKNFCGREECTLMEYRFRSCKFVFDLFDVDHDGLLTMNDYKFLKDLWNLGCSPLDAQEMSIDFESFFQVFPSIDVYEVGTNYEKDRASNLVDFHTRSGSLPPQASSHFREVFYERRSKEEEEERHKRNIRMIYELNRLFSLLDYDEDDKLDSEEVEILLRGCKLPEVKVKEISYKVDVIWGGRIGFLDLLNLLRDLEPYTLNPLRIIENPSEILKILDRNQDGFLSASDLKRFVLITGHDISDEDIQGLILELDIEGSENVLIPNMLELSTDKRFNLSHLSNVNITPEVVADHKIKEEFISFWELDYEWMEDDDYY